MTDIQMMRIFIAVMPAMAVTAALVFSGAPARAQDKAAEPIAPSTVCLTRQVRGGKEDGKSLVIGIPADEAEEFMKRGFEPADCSTTQVIESSRKQGFCKIARARNRALDVQFWQRFGFTPEEGCETISAASMR